jgi:hypothetical protein
MINRQRILFMLVLFVLILTACAPKTTAASPSPQQPSGGLVTKDKAPFAIAAKAALSQKLAIPQEQVSFVSADGIEWTDSCLGLGGPAESCLQAVTPGYKVILAVEGKQYEIHTDESGSAVRIKE